MAITPINHVAPGDLITAAFFNDVVDALASLQKQIDAIATGPGTPDGPVIKSVLPSGGVTAGAQMTIVGENFAVPALLNTVKLDSTPLTDFVSGTDTSIVVVVPASIAGLPKSMLLSIETTDGKDELDVTVLAPVITPTGQIKVTNVTGQLGKITKDGTFTYQMKLDASGLNIAEDFVVRVDYVNGVGATPEAWKAATTYVGTDADHVVRVAPGGPVTVGITFKVPTTAQSVDMIVNVISVHNDPASSSASPAIPIKVDEAPLPSHPSIALTINQHLTSNVKNKTFTGDVAGNGLGVKLGANGLVTLHAAVQHSGSYKFDAKIEKGDDTIWKVTDLPQTLTLGDGGAKGVQFNLQLVPTTPPAESVRRYLVFTATRQETTGVGQISNYLRFPIGELP